MTLSINIHDRYVEYAEHLMVHKMNSYSQRDSTHSLAPFYSWIEDIEEHLNAKDNVMPKPTYLPLYDWFCKGVLSNHAADWILWHIHKCADKSL